MELAAKESGCEDTSEDSDGSLASPLLSSELSAGGPVSSGYWGSSEPEGSSGEGVGTGSAVSSRFSAVSELKTAM